MNEPTISWREINVEGRGTGLRQIKRSFRRGVRVGDLVYVYLDQEWVKCLVSSIGVRTINTKVWPW
jgi:tRNA threonylcarbamoyladenosine modification (KEOPS) complex Cgi121 subunit